MRHAASLIVAMEGVSRPAFLIARELANNSRSGLTVRFLSKKLDLPEDEVEYLVDINHRFLFTDLTKIKLVPEGFSAIKRISDGLENRGDVPSLYRLVKQLSPHDFRRLEEQIGLDKPGPKKHAVEEYLGQAYQHPDAIVTYVATRNFSDRAREAFDQVWQAPDGLMPMSRLRALLSCNEYDLELALWEHLRSFTLFEMFRFDSDERLVRFVGLLSEIRQYRDALAHDKANKTRLRPYRGTPGFLQDLEVAFSDRLCRIVASLAAHPAHLRGDGDLFREDIKRLEEICPEGTAPSLSTCLWAAEGLGWISRVDNELRAGELKTLLDMDRLSRHKLLYDWFSARDTEKPSFQAISNALDEVKPGVWYSAIDFVNYASRTNAQVEQPVIKAMGAHWEYVSPSTSSHAQSTLAHAVEETFLWLGIVARGEDGGNGVFKITELGEYLLTGQGAERLGDRYPKREAEIIVQPNFEIVVPLQDMDPLLTVSLDQFAERISTGQASVYRVTKETFTQAIQEGHSGDSFVNFLVAHNRGGGLPSNVMMTLEDWRGGMKRVRLRTIQVVESDDPLVLADLQHRRRFKKFFRTIDPHTTIAYAKVTKAELAKALEKDGFIIE